MNSWCESCARKNCCYTMEIRPRCYVATTNTASGTPENYLAKSLRYSRDSHTIPETEQTNGYMTAEQMADYNKMLDKADRKVYGNIEDGPQTYNKGLQLFADILFDKEKSEQFLKECKALGIEPQTERSRQ